MEKVSCIIPMYNEAPRISGVLNILTQVQNIGEIICVDDASSDSSAQIVQQQFPQVQCIRHTSNQGKSGAIKTGLYISSYDSIFLCDADLQGIIQKEFEQAIKIFFEKKADMVILKRENAPIHIKAFRGHVLITGERIMKKTDLQNITNQIIDTKKIKKSPGILESTINRYMMENKKKCLWMPSSATNTFKTTKYGLINGLLKDIEMYYEMDLIENKFLEQIIGFHIESGLDQPGIIDKLVEYFELIDDQP